MSAAALTALALAMLALSASPGPGVAAVVGRSIQAGFGQALIAIAGLVLGDLVYMSAAVAGWSAIASRMGEFFFWVRLAGAAYLIVLGIKSWRSARAFRAAALDGQASAGGSFGIGLSVTLSNPKAIAFYLGIMPTLLNPRAFTSADVAAVSAIIAASSFLVLGAYAALAARAAARLAGDRRFARRLSKTSGAILAGTGVVLAAKTT